MNNDSTNNKILDSVLYSLNTFVNENYKQQRILMDELQKIKTRLNNLENNNQEENTDKMYSAWCKDILEYIEQIAKKHFPDTDVWCDTGSRYNVVMAMLQQIDKTLEDI